MRAVSSIGYLTRMGIHAVDVLESVPGTNHGDGSTTESGGWSSILLGWISLWLRWTISGVTESRTEKTSGGLIGEKSTVISKSRGKIADTGSKEINPKLKPKLNVKLPEALMVSPVVQLW